MCGHVSPSVDAFDQQVFVCAGEMIAEGTDLEKMSIHDDDRDF